MGAYEDNDNEGLEGGYDANDGTGCAAYEEYPLLAWDEGSDVGTAVNDAERKRDILFANALVANDASLEDFFDMFLSKN